MGAIFPSFSRSSPPPPNLPLGVRDPHAGGGGGGRKRRGIAKAYAANGSLLSKLLEPNSRVAGPVSDKAFKEVKHRPTNWALFMKNYTKTTYVSYASYVPTPA